MKALNIKFEVYWSQGHSRSPKIKKLENVSNKVTF